jgi:ketosteroid isomerase-like protein
MSNEFAPIQTPVTGREELQDASDPRRALSDFYRAINARDLALMEKNWDHSPEAAMDNPLGGIRRGWSEIRQTYERLFNTQGTYSFEFWDYTAHQSGELFWVVGGGGGPREPKRGKSQPARTKNRPRPPNPRPKGASK